MSKQNLYRTAAVVTIFSVIEKAFGFLYRIILSHVLGPEGVGIYQLALSVFAVLLTLAASGLPLTVSRLITKYRAENNLPAQQSVISAALLCALCFSFPIFLTLYFTPDTFSFLFSDPRCMTVLRILLPGLVFNSVYSVLRGAMWGNKQFVPYCAIDLAEELAMIIAGTILIHGMSDLFSGARRAAAAIVLSYAVSFTLSVLFFISQKGKLKRPNKQFKPLLSSSAPITGMRVSGSLINSVISLLLPVRLMAAGFSNSDALREIGIATGMSMPVLTIPATLIGSLALVLIPELADNFYRNAHRKMRLNIEHALQLSTLTACILIPNLFSLGEILGIILFANRHSGIIIRNCSAMILPMSLDMISSGILNSIGCEKRTCIHFFCGATATLLSICFLPNYVGIYAWMIGIAASELICMILNLHLIQKKCKEKVHFLKHTFCCTATVIPTAVFGILLKNVLIRFLPPLIAVGLCATAISVTECLLLFITGLAHPRWLKLLFKKS